jgi:taurine dioxygenase
LVIRDQNLSEADQIRAAGYFGKVAVRAKPKAGQSTPGGSYDTPFMLVTNIVENGQPIGAFGDGEMWFHHDTSYYPEPHRATLLYSMKLPSWGGNTCFSNMYQAYENIPRALRDRLEGRKVLQVHDYKRRERLDLDKIDLANVRHQWQPIFITHPATGRKSLYISRLMSAQIEGLSKEESEAALEQLFDISEDPAIVYEHELRLGDLVIWDNWCSIHARKDFPREQPRLMRRLTIEGQAMRF